MTTKNIPTITASYEFLFGYLEEQKPYSPTMFEFVLSNYERRYKKNLWFSILAKWFAFKPSKNVKYIFIGCKYKDIIIGLPRKDVLVVGSGFELFFCLKNRIPFFHDLPVLEKVLNSQQNTISYEPSTLWQLIQNKISKSCVIVINNDSLPFERMFCLLAKEAGTRTVCIQHGVFSKSAPSRLYDGGVADLMLVFDKHQKSMLVDAGISEKKLEVMGFHSDIQRYTHLAVGFNRRVCILGQPWGNYYPSINKKYLELLDELASILSEQNIEYVFKPHPGEWTANYINNYGEVESASLIRCFKQYDVFISFTSTALIEATLAGRLAIQVFDPIFYADHFESLGYAYSVDSKQLFNIIELICNAEPINQNLNENVTASERFCRVVGCS